MARADAYAPERPSHASADLVGLSASLASSGNESKLPFSGNPLLLRRVSCHTPEMQWAPGVLRLSGGDRGAGQQNWSLSCFPNGCHCRHTAGCGRGGNLVP